MSIRQEHPGRVEDYTTPFLVTACALIFVALFAVWAWAGLLWVLFSAWMAAKGLGRAERRAAIRSGLER